MIDIKDTHMTIRKNLTAAAAAVAVITGTWAGATACSNQYNDQGGVRQVSPDFIQTYLNVDGFANITLLCIDGQGFATTTRDYTSLIPVTGWNTFCATVAKTPDQATLATIPNQ